jgi:RHS repeat-associated protein
MAASTRDSYTGFDYADQRYYASSYGRFNTADPYQASGGPASPASWNRYSYVEGDPVNNVDPSGQFTLSPCALMGGWACDPFAGLWMDGPAFNPSAYAECLAVPQFCQRGSGANFAKGVVVGFLPDLSAAHQALIDASKRALLQDLRNNSNCLNWLDGGMSGAQFIATWNKTTIGADMFIGDQTVVAVMGSPAASTTIAINSIGLFFAGSGPVGYGVPSAIGANTPLGREFILLHEMAHVFGSKGFNQNDGSSTQAETDNNTLILKNCGSIFARGTA